MPTSSGNNTELSATNAQFAFNLFNVAKPQNAEKVMGRSQQETSSPFRVRLIDGIRVSADIR